MDERRAALFLDFDNVFSTLHDAAGAEVAFAFAEQPARWLEWLSEGGRRFLLRRCYLNPAGYKDNPDGARTYHSAFRWAFQAAGFEVVDCPNLTRLKNAADIRIVLDTMDALAAATRYDEFTLLATDADFVPLLLRLRAADRRTRLLAHPRTGPIVRAVADEFLGLDDFARRLGWGADPRTRTGAPGRPQGDAPFGEGPDILDVVGQIVGEQPVHVPHLGKLVLDRTGHSLRESRWGGTGSLEQMCSTLGLTRIPGPAGGYVARQGGDVAPPVPEADTPVEAP